MKTIRKGQVLITLLAVAGCSRGITGTYVDEGGITRYAFSNDGNVQIHVLDASVAAEYRLDGDRVLITSGQGTVVLTRRDNRLIGPMGLELIRQSSKRKEEL